MSTCLPVWFIICNHDSDDEYICNHDSDDEYICNTDHQTLNSDKSFNFKYICLF
jgi:hypothetical protein